MRHRLAAFVNYCLRMCAEYTKLAAKSPADAARMFFSPATLRGLLSGPTVFDLLSGERIVTSANLYLSSLVDAAV